MVDRVSRNILEVQLCFWLLIFHCFLFVSSAKIGQLEGILRLEGARTRWLVQSLVTHVAGLKLIGQIIELIRLRLHFKTLHDHVFVRAFNFRLIQECFNLC